MMMMTNHSSLRRTLSHFLLPGLIYLLLLVIITLLAYIAPESLFIFPLDLRHCLVNFLPNYSYHSHLSTLWPRKTPHCTLYIIIRSLCATVDTLHLYACYVRFLLSSVSFIAIGLNVTVIHYLFLKMRMSVNTEVQSFVCYGLFGVRG